MIITNKITKKKIQITFDDVDQDYITFGKFNYKKDFYKKLNPADFNISDVTTYKNTYAYAVYLKSNNNFFSGICVVNSENNNVTQKILDPHNSKIRKIQLFDNTLFSNSTSGNFLQWKLNQSGENSRALIPFSIEIKLYKILNPQNTHILYIEKEKNNKNLFMAFEDIANSNIKKLMLDGSHIIKPEFVKSYNKKDEEDDESPFLIISSDQNIYIYDQANRFIHIYKIKPDDQKMKTIAKGLFTSLKSTVNISGNSKIELSKTCKRSILPEELKYKVAKQLFCNDRHIFLVYEDQIYSIEKKLLEGDTNQSITGSTIFNCANNETIVTTTLQYKNESFSFDFIIILLDNE